MKESVFETLTLMGCSRIHQQMTRNQWEEKNKKEERGEERGKKRKETTETVPSPCELYL